MIRDHNIAIDAAIMPHKIIGSDLTGETFWTSKTNTAPYAWLRDRVPSDRLYATLDRTLDEVTASRGDVIKIAPYHTETITGAGGVTLDKAGVTIQGLGRYNQRPNFLMDGAACSMLVTADGMALENCKFFSGHADLAYLALVTGTGFRFSNNYVGENTTDENFKIVISIGAADYDANGVEILNNEFIGVDDDATGSIVINKNMNDVKLIGNSITGAFDNTPYAPILMPDGEIALNMQCFHNRIHNLHDDNAVVGISMLEAVSTGWMMYNHCYALDVAGETPFLVGATGIYCSQNMMSYQANLSGFEYPAINTV